MDPEFNAMENVKLILKLEGNNTRWKQSLQTLTAQFLVGTLSEGIESILSGMNMETSAYVI